ncbi:MAG: carboxypeptidase-like regulatory domain-containing protein [Terracidiphilus sp.]
MMCIARSLAALFLSAVFHATGFAQQFAAPDPQPVSAPDPQPANIAGTVTDTNGGIIPGAEVVVVTPTQDPHSAITDDNGFFRIENLTPGTGYEVTVSAKGFGNWKSPEVLLSPGQFGILESIKLPIEGGAVSVTVVASREELAVEQVKVEEQQRVLGFIPNFYVSYDRDAAPLTAKLKFELALKVSVDPVTFAGTSFLAAVNQAARYPDYEEGWTGYGQRFGSIYTNDLTDIMVGGAILPSILHQDPRYFYQGTGTTKSRWLHALSSPLICKGDNGRWQPNYSSLGGYLASGAIANAYFPEANRGAGLVAHTFAVDFSANIANAVLQEFVLRKLTPSAKAGH